MVPHPLFRKRAPENVTMKSAPACSRHFATRPVPHAATNIGLPLLIFFCILSSISSLVCLLTIIPFFLLLFE
jgi:hypothetical protein